MSSVDDTPIEHNKDFDKGDNAEDWSDDYLQIAIFDQLMI